MTRARSTFLPISLMWIFKPSTLPQCLKESPWRKLHQKSRPTPSANPRSAPPAWCLTNTTQPWRLVRKFLSLPPNWKPGKMPKVSSGSLRSVMKSSSNPSPTRCTDSRPPNVLWSPEGIKATSSCAPISNDSPIPPRISLMKPANHSPKNFSIVSKNTSTGISRKTPTTNVSWKPLRRCRSVDTTSPS
nr:MAG: hypothetical protein [Chemarfal virus 145]